MTKGKPANWVTNIINAYMKIETSSQLRRPHITIWDVHYYFKKERILQITYGDLMQHL